MLFSKNDFFYQPLATLFKLKGELKDLLRLKKRSEEDIFQYMRAYEFFINRPDKYDGATIVKDLVDIRNGKYYLDADAMLHDFEYIRGASSNFLSKWKCDLRYIKNMEKNGKGVRVFRLIILTFFGLFLVPYTNLKNI